MSSPPPGEPAPSSPTEARCPECGADLPPGAVLCVNCGYDLREGRRLETVREPAPAALDAETAETTEAAEYRLPDLSLAAPIRKKELEKNLDLETRVFWLEERLRELERRVAGTRLTSPEFSTRVFAVMGLWLVGFLTLGFSVGALLALLWVTIVGR